MLPLFSHPSKGEQETQEAFELHFTKEISLYDNVCIVNLVEQNGKEKLIGDTYAKHVMKYNNVRLTYVTFDFHDYWCVNRPLHQ